MISKETKIYDRRIILIDSERNLNQFNINEYVKKILSKVRYNNLPKFVRRNSIVGTTVRVLENTINANIDLNNIAKAKIDYCLSNFKFPPQHPQKGIVYSCTDMEPSYYFPISNFHKFTLDLKECAFIEMCAHLGAKEILLKEEKIDNVKRKINLEVENIPTQSGDFSSKLRNEQFKNSNTRDTTSFSFPKPSKKIIDEEYYNKWIDTEPTWKTLQKVRLENKVLEFIAEFNYSDEMGINSELAASLVGSGFNIGGEFNKIKKIERVYKVVFWGE
ncbi:hypothetical protein [Oceanihabitans sediminis]|uniref:hypothetical protein n=1 Tax=Oceanihabitans sediminis TaxID=1812012 RepID=UPI003A8F7EAE